MSHAPEPCVCNPTEFPFRCERHRMDKTSHWLNLCRTRDDYRDKWDRDTLGLPPRGLGDVVAKVARVTGVARLVKRIVGKRCGCAKRQAALNRWWQFR